MKKTILLGVLAITGCASKAFVQEQIEAQNKALLAIGIKVVEHEAKLHPEKAQSLKEGIEKGELRLEPGEIVPTDKKK
jgi:hypothetical protein